MSAAVLALYQLPRYDLLGLQSTMYLALHTEHLVNFCSEQGARNREEGAENQGAGSKEQSALYIGYSMIKLNIRNLKLSKKYYLDFVSFYDQTYIWSAPMPAPP